MKNSVKIWGVVIAVLLFLIIAMVLVCWWIYDAVTDTSDAYLLNTTASTTIYEPMVKSVILGEPQKITDDDINGIVAKIMESSADDSLQDNTEEAINQSDGTELDKPSTVLIKGASIYLQGDNIAKLYVDLEYKGYRIIFSADTELKLDTQTKTITVNLSNTKLGRLKVPVDFITGQISASLTEISDGIQVGADRIVLPSEYNFEFLGKDVTLYIADLQIAQGSATIQTNSAMDIISQFIDEIIAGLFK